MKCVGVVKLIYESVSLALKCTGIQYLEALCNLYENGKRFERTIYVIFVPDEEIGGETGMAPFVETTKFAGKYSIICTHALVLKSY